MLNLAARLRWGGYGPTISNIFGEPKKEEILKADLTSYFSDLDEMCHIEGLRHCKFLLPRLADLE